MLRRAIAGTGVTLLLAACLLLAAPAAFAGGGCHQASEPQVGNTVKMEGNCFMPGVIHAEPGDVKFINDSGVLHSVTGEGSRWGTELTDGQRAVIAFDDPGVFPFSCVYHPGMIGTIVVGDGVGPGLNQVQTPDTPEVVEDAVEDVTEPVTDAVGDVTGPGDAAASASGSGSGGSGTSAPMVALVSAALGLGGGLILGGRLRLPGRVLATKAVAR